MELWAPTYKLVCAEATKAKRCFAFGAGGWYVSKSALKLKFGRY